MAKAYRVQKGVGTESARGYNVLIYDAQSVTPDQIENLPTTLNFLTAGKILIVLSPSPDDRQSLERELGATALTDSPAVAVFNAYTRDSNLQTVNMVEFPTTADEDAIQTGPPGPASASQEGLTSTDLAETDAVTLRAQTNQWRKLYENKHAEAEQALRALSGISAAQFAAAASNTDGAATTPMGADSDAMDLLSSKLAPKTEIPPAKGSQFLTVQPFFHYLPKTFNLESIYYQPRFQSIYPKAVQSGTRERRGLCLFFAAQCEFSTAAGDHHPRHRQRGNRDLSDSATDQWRLQP